MPTASSMLTLGKAISNILIITVIETKPIVKATTCLNFPRSPADFAMPKYLFIPRWVFKISTVTIIVTNEIMALVSPMASAPASRAIMSQKRSVSPACIIVLIEVKMTFLPTFASNYTSPK